MPTLRENQAGKMPALRGIQARKMPAPRQRPALLGGGHPARLMGRNARLLDRKRYKDRFR
ncbi:MAG TPA: hypothetical protein PK579_01130 [Phycisphaerae bacterium]|nr:hypothetical protein [Phycisphaerae bacterium]